MNKVLSVAVFGGALSILACSSFFGANNDPYQLAVPETGTNDQEHLLSSLNYRDLKLYDAFYSNKDGHRILYVTRKTESGGYKTFGYPLRNNINEKDIPDSLVLSLIESRNECMSTPELMRCANPYLYHEVINHYGNNNSVSNLLKELEKTINNNNIKDYEEFRGNILR